MQNEKPIGTFLLEWYDVDFILVVSPGYPILMPVALINEYLVARLLCSPEYEVSLSKKKFFRLKYHLL